MEFGLPYFAPASLSLGSMGAACLAAFLAFWLAFVWRDRYVAGKQRLRTSFALALTTLFAASAWGGTAGLVLLVWGNLVGVPGAEFHGLLGVFTVFLAYPALLSGPALVLAAGFVPESAEGLRRRWWLPRIVAPSSAFAWAWFLTSQSSFCAMESEVHLLAQDFFTWAVAAMTSLGCGFTLSDAARRRSAASSDALLSGDLGEATPGPGTAGGRVRAVTNPGPDGSGG